MTHQDHMTQVICDHETIGHGIDPGYLPYMIKYRLALFDLLQLSAVDLSHFCSSNEKKRLNEHLVNEEFVRATEWINNCYLLIKSNSI